MPLDLTIYAANLTEEQRRSGGVGARPWHHSRPLLSGAEGEADSGGDGGDGGDGYDEAAEVAAAMAQLTGDTSAEATLASEVGGGDGGAAIRPPSLVGSCASPTEAQLGGIFGGAPPGTNTLASIEEALRNSAARGFGVEHPGDRAPQRERVAGDASAPADGEVSSTDDESVERAMADVARRRGILRKLIDAVRTGSELRQWEPSPINGPSSYAGERASAAETVAGDAGDDARGGAAQEVGSAAGSPPRPPAPIGGFDFDALLRRRPDIDVPLRQFRDQLALRRPLSAGQRQRQRQRQQMAEAVTPSRPDAPSESVAMPGQLTQQAMPQVQTGGSGQQQQQQQQAMQQAMRRAMQQMQASGQQQQPVQQQQTAMQQAMQQAMQAMQQSMQQPQPQQQ